IGIAGLNIFCCNIYLLQGQTVQGQTVQGQTVQGQTVQGQTVQGKTVHGQTAWEQHLIEGRKLRAQGLYAQAEKEYLAALDEASVFGQQDPRLARTTNNLAGLYQDQGRFADAEKLFRKSAAIWEANPDQSLDLSVC